MQNEEWRVIPSLVGYEASSFGRIRDWNTHDKIWPPHRHGDRLFHYFDNVKLEEPVIVKLYTKRKKPTVWVVHRGRKRLELCARLVAEAWLGPRPTEDHRPAPINRNYDDVRPENLRWVHWRRRGGEHPRVDGRKITAEIAKKIRESLAAGLPAAALADKYGVRGSMISKIRYGEKWKHAGGPSATRKPKPDEKPKEPKPKKKNEKTKLTGNQVAEIRQKLADGEMKKTIALEYSVSPATISAIWHGKRWSDAGGPTKKMAELELMQELNEEREAALAEVMAESEVKSSDDELEPSEADGSHAGNSGIKEDPHELE